MAKETIKPADKSSTGDKPENTTPAASERMGMQVGVATSSIISSSKTEVDENKGLVQVRIAYPKDYTAKKFYQDGDEPFVSEEVAAQFIDNGIAEKI